MAQHLATTQTEAYNPDQDRDEVLQIRKKYTELRVELDKNRRELVKADSEKLSELIDEANLVFSRGKNWIFGFGLFMAMYVCTYI